MQKAGKRKKINNIERKLAVNASTVMASGSGFQDMKFDHLALEREANKSMSGLPKRCTIVSNALSDNSHSVSGLGVFLDSASATFSFVST